VFSISHIEFYLQAGRMAQVVECLCKALSSNPNHNTHTHTQKQRVLSLENWCRSFCRKFGIGFLIYMSLFNFLNLSNLIIKCFNISQLFLACASFLVVSTNYSYHHGSSFLLFVCLLIFNLMPDIVTSPVGCWIFSISINIPKLCSMMKLIYLVPLWSLLIFLLWFVSESRTVLSSISHYWEMIFLYILSNVLWFVFFPPRLDVETGTIYFNFFKLFCLSLD
jgi:hypothetical protein